MLNLKKISTIYIMRKLLTNLLTTSFCLLMICAVQAQTYDECDFPGPSNPAVEPDAPINPAYPQATPVICADGAFPECSTPTTADGDADFAAACGSPNYDFIITNPQNTNTGDGGAAIVEVSADGSFNPTGAVPPDFAVGDQACVTGFCYDLQQIIDLVNEINDNPSACSAAESTAGVPVCPIPVPTSLSDLFTLASTIGGGGSVSVGDVVAILPQLDNLGALGINNVPVCGLLSGGDTAAGANSADYCLEVVDCSENGSPCEAEAPCAAIDLTAAPAAPVVTSESTCGADDMTLEGGMIDYSGSTCPEGSTLEYATDGMTFTTTAPMYDQENAITVTVRCTCDADMTMTSPTAEVTTVPGACDAAPCEGIDLTAAPAAPVVTSESTCGADGMTLEGGVIDYAGSTCPEGSTLEYATDGVTFTTTAPMYDQENAITVTVRCTCDADMTMTSPTAEVTTVPGSCGVVDPNCTAMAGEPVADAPAEICGATDGTLTDVTDIFDPATGGFDDGTGMIDPVVTNYVAVDATGNIIDVADSMGMLDFSGVAEGEQACVYQLAYTQALLNDVTMFLDELLCETLCVDVPLAGTTCIGDVGYCPGVTPTELAPLLDVLNTAFGFNEEQICDLIDNEIITIVDPTGLLEDQVIDLDAVGLGLCADKSTKYCATVAAAACMDVEPVVCDLVAGEPVPPNDTVCATGTATMGEVEQGMIDVTGVFGPPTMMTGDFTPVQNYVIADPVTGEIISVSDMAILDLTDAMIGDQACVSSFAYYAELVEILGEALEDQLCNTLCIPDPADPLSQLCPGDLLPDFNCGDMITDFSMILDLLNQLNTAQGLTNVTFDDVVALCETQMLTINVGDLLGVPGSPDVVIDLTLIPGLMGDGFCCDFSDDQHCLTVIDCAPMCQGIDPAVLPVIPTEVCSGATTDICLTLIDAAEGLEITGSIDGAPITLIGVAGANPNELCVTITAPENMTCDIVPVSIQIDAIQCTNGTDFPGIAAGPTLVDDLTSLGFNPIEIPVYPTLVVNTMGDGMCGTLTATLEAADGTVCATAMGSPFACAADGDVLDYDFTGIPELADFTAPPADCPLPALSGTLTCTGCGMQVPGCTDPCADNFDPAATMDDGSCNPVDTTCNNDCTMGPFGGSFDPVACVCTDQTEPVLGCTDPNADNFNVAANCDDGTCIIVTPCNFSVGVSAFTCNDGDTMDDPSDDTADVTFVVLSNGADFTTDVAIGGVTSGMDGMLLTEIGVAAGTNIVVTFTSVDDPNCTFVLDYTVPDCTVQVPTLSQWGLISLALLLMIMGSLKLGFSTTTFNSIRKNN